MSKSGVLISCYYRFCALRMRWMSLGQRKVLQMALLVLLLKRRVKKKRIWSKPWPAHKATANLGACAFVQDELSEENLRSFLGYAKMTLDQFERLHSMVERRIHKEDTIFRQSIPTRFKLMVTLRFLATGETFMKLGNCTRIAASTISSFLPDVLSAIYEELEKGYLKVPSTSDEWRAIAADFQNATNIPNVIGAMSAKRLTFRGPRFAAPECHDDERKPSIVLLAVADARCRFLYINVGANGRASNQEVYEDCDFAEALNANDLSLPNNENLPGMNLAVPFVVLAGATFPLESHVLKPFPTKNITQEERVCNHRLKRGMRVADKAFEMLCSRFGVLVNCINMAKDKVVLITQACCALHNFIHVEASNELQNVVDADDEEAEDVVEDPCTWALVMRNQYKKYFNGVGKEASQDCLKCDV